MDIKSRSPMQLRHWHYWTSLTLCAVLIPVLRAQHLPLKFDWITLGVAYWLVLAAQSIFVATILALIGLPGVWEPFVDRYRKNPIRIAIVFLYFGILLWATTGMKPLVLTVDTIALLELRERQRANGLRHPAVSVLVPAAYLFLGFLMVLGYNCAIVSARFNFAYDPALAAIDRFLLRGHSVSEFTHWAVGTFPPAFFRLLEFIYFGMFPQIGATILLLALRDGKKSALQFVGTILISYYLALAIFYIWPSQGPYYLCLDHFSRFPANLQAFNIQKTLITHALARWHHDPIARIPTDYYIGLPCMHIAQPLVVMWFVRRWRRILIALAAYDVLLVAAVVLLEWHYFVDIVAGIFVAALAITTTRGTVGRKAPQPVPAAPGTMR